jgi:hypothetical protein
MLHKQCLSQSAPFDSRDSSSEHAVKVLRQKKNRKARIFCCLPVAKSKSIKKQGILKQPLSTPGVHKSVQIPVKNDEKIKHNGISHIL